MAVRVEDVEFHGYQFPAPADFLAAPGTPPWPSSARDPVRQPQLPVLAQLGLIRGVAVRARVGDVHLSPSSTLEGKQYFTTGSRPDGSGKRTLTLRGLRSHRPRHAALRAVLRRLPRSMRGFYYRASAPTSWASTSAASWVVGSIEYHVPLTAGDKLQQVFFSDFGTVEANYSSTTSGPRSGPASAWIPRTGPLPLAFDLAFPVAKADGDQLPTSPSRSARSIEPILKAPIPSRNPMTGK